jgi:hypothetical protein
VGINKHAADMMASASARKQASGKAIFAVFMGFDLKGCVYLSLLPSRRIR